VTCESLEKGFCLILVAGILFEKSKKPSDGSKEVSMAEFEDFE
jgi:hypothetical protein